MEYIILIILIIASISDYKRQKVPVITMKLIIDRLEGDFAVAELPNGKMEVCPKAIFPDDVQEGDIIELYIDKKAMEEKKNSVKSKMNKLFRD